MVAFFDGIQQALALLLSVEGLLGKDEQEHKSGALTPLGDTGDVTTELLHYLLADVES